jgi:uncharacterized membrane protein YeaQ/YmgE (transglycosylase-associated protein family)
MDAFVIIVVGGVVGWLASIVMRTDVEMGLLANVVVGVAGSLLGFMLAGALDIGANERIGRWAVSVVGAALLIAQLTALGVFRRSTLR